MTPIEGANTAIGQRIMNGDGTDQFVVDILYISIVLLMLAIITAVRWLGFIVRKLTGTL